MKTDSLGALVGFWATLGGNGFQGIVLAMETDSFGALAGFRATTGWKWLPGHRFRDDNGRLGSSGRLLGDFGLEMDPRASFWQWKLTLWELWRASVRP